MSTRFPKVEGLDTPPPAPKSLWPWVVGIVSVFAVLGVLIVALISAYVSAYNYGNQVEQDLKAAQADAKNIFAQYGQKVLEATQVTTLYKDDLAEVMERALTARYGEEGSQAVVQWIQEQNGTLSPEMYVKVQQIIESGRNDFANAQRRQIDIRRQYETALGSFWQGFWLKQAGYPKITLSDYDIVSTSRADKAFETKVEDGPIQLRPE